MILMRLRRVLESDAPARHRSVARALGAGLTRWEAALKVQSGVGILSRFLPVYLRLLSVSLLSIQQRFLSCFSGYIRLFFSINYWKMKILIVVI